MKKLFIDPRYRHGITTVSTRPGFKFKSHNTKQPSKLLTNGPSILASVRQACAFVKPKLYGIPSSKPVFFFANQPAW